ncbi:hypothetical protein BH09PLA1_BH09PLA1_04560 [soil metagenome]
MRQSIAIVVYHRAMRAKFKLRVQKHLIGKGHIVAATFRLLGFCAQGSWRAGATYRFRTISTSTLRPLFAYHQPGTKSTTSSRSRILAG